MTIDFPKATDLPGLKGLWSRCFGDPMALIDRFFATGFSPARCRCLRIEDRVVGALYWLDGWQGEDRLAYIYAVATDPDFQNRGICRGLMADTHSLLGQAGYAGAVLVPGSEPLFAMYEKMGYRPFGGIREFTCTPADKAVPLQKLSPEEYARRRRALLPAGGVVQEGETLAWLGCFAEFYAGPDCLLAGTVDKDTLLAQELLGNAAAAPGILAAMGTAHGRFRVPGKEKSFAMYCPMNREAPPAYFGLALD